MELELISIPTIVTIVCGVMELLKKTINKEGFNRFIPLISVLFGGVLGIATFYVAPTLIPATDPMTALLIGFVSGWAATGANQTVKQLVKNKTNNEK